MGTVVKNQKQSVEKMILSQLAAPTEELTQAEIAKKIKRDSSNVGKTLNKMIKNGLIERNKITKRFKITQNGKIDNLTIKNTKHYKAVHCTEIKNQVKTGTDPVITKIINNLFSMTLEELKQNRPTKGSGGLFISIF